MTKVLDVIMKVNEERHRRVSTSDVNSRLAELLARRQPPQAAAMLDHVLSCTANGSRETVAAGLRAFIARTGADEVMLTSSIYDQTKRKRSLAIAADVMRTL